MKLCKDCKHCKRGLANLILMPFDSYNFSKCYRKKDTARSLLDGKQRIKEESTYCSIERDFEHLCGKDGLYFEAKQ